jgi:hypothetical protein
MTMFVVPVALVGGRRYVAWEGDDQAQQREEGRNPSHPLRNGTDSGKSARTGAR